MDSLSAFKEPGVFIPLLFTLLFYLFPSHGKQLGDWLIKCVGSLCLPAKKYLKVKCWGYKRRFLNRVHNPSEVNWHIVRTYSLMLMFSMAITVYVLLIALGPLKGIAAFPFGVQWFIYSPVLVLEALWLNQRDYTRSLINAVVKRQRNYHRNDI
jgi:hypothetical protein